VLLHRTETAWAWPADGALSTHIVKPDPLGGTGIEGLVRLEHWTLLLAQASGVPAARSELLTVDGRKVIVVERYDRTGERRSHQGDLAQAFGLATQDKFESSGRSPCRTTRCSSTLRRRTAAHLVRRRPGLPRLLGVPALRARRRGPEPARPRHTGAFLVDEAVSWGLGHAPAAETIVSVASAVVSGLSEMHVPVPHDDVPDTVAERALCVARSAKS